MFLVLAKKILQYCMFFLKVVNWIYFSFLFSFFFFWWQLCASKCCTCFNELSLFIRHRQGFLWNTKTYIQDLNMHTRIGMYTTYIQDTYICSEFQLKNLLGMCLMNRLNSLKHVQHFDAHNCHQKRSVHCRSIVITLEGTKRALWIIDS